MMKHLYLKAYGEINLALDILGRWADGHREVRATMQIVGFHDRIDLYVTQEPGIKIEINLPYLSDDKQNLARKVARSLVKEFGIRQGLSIYLRKFIPVSVGKAGGSTDAAFVLFGAGKMFGLSLSTGELTERGVTLGADIPYCLMWGTALSEEIGERLLPLPLTPQYQVLIAESGISVLTKVVHENLDATKLAPSDHPDVGDMIDAVRSWNLREAAGRFGNVLELATGERHPAILGVERVMRDYGALGVIVNGGGPTMSGLFVDPRTAQAAYEDLRFGKASELAEQVYLTSFFNVKRNGQDMA